MGECTLLAPTTASSGCACVTTAASTADDSVATRRTRRSVGTGRSRTTVGRATAIAEQLLSECSILLELYVSSRRICEVLWFQPSS